MLSAHLNLLSRYVQILLHYIWTDLKGSGHEEYAISHLLGAFLAVDEDEALKIIAKKSKDRFIIVYCSVGYRSSELANILLKKGFTKVYNLEGSIFKWANEGREIYQGDQLVNTVHPFNSNWKHLLDKRFWHNPEKL